MSALGQKRKFKRLQPMSALPPKADIAEHCRHVRFVPIGDKALRGNSSTSLPSETWPLFIV